MAEGPEIALVVVHGPTGFAEDFAGGDVEDVGLTDLILVAGLVIGGVALDEGIDAESEEEVVGVNEVEAERGLALGEVEHAGRLEAERLHGNGGGRMERGRLRGSFLLMGRGEAGRREAERDEHGRCQKDFQRQPLRGNHGLIVPLEAFSRNCFANGTARQLDGAWGCLWLYLKEAVIPQE